LHTRRLLGERDNGQEERTVRIVAIELEIGGVGGHPHLMAGAVLHRIPQGFATVHGHGKPFRPHPFPVHPPERHDVVKTRQVVRAQGGRPKPIRGLGSTAGGRCGGQARDPEFLLRRIKVHRAEASAVIVTNEVREPRTLWIQQGVNLFPLLPC
jgi:hypothetical protein